MLIEDVSAQGCVQEAGEAEVVRIVDVADAQRPFHLGGAVIGEGGRAVFDVHHVVRIRGEPRDEAGEGAVYLLRLLRRAADDQGGARLVDEDAVHLVHYGVVVGRVRPLGRLGEVHHHVVSEIVEPKLVVGAVSDVRPVGLPAGDGNQIAQAGVVQVSGGVKQVGGVVLEDADAEAQRVVDGAHPLRIALGQVVVHGHHVHALALQRVQVEGHGGCQGLALTRLHLGDLALVKCNAAQHLHIEVTEADAPFGDLPHNGERLRKNIVQSLPHAQAGEELIGLGSQLSIGEGGHLAADLVHPLEQGPELAQFLLIVVAAQGPLDRAYDHLLHTRLPLLCKLATPAMGHRFNDSRKAEA